MRIVLGSLFGDEGKGLMTSYLCNESIKQGRKPLVLRHSGGQQCGHSVIHEGNRHVFSNFGSGTLQGVPTYWSEYCTFSPLGVLNEYNALKKIKGIEPHLMVSSLSPVTTPYDRQFNCTLDAINKHGSCGLGIGATHQRQEDHYKLFVQDLFYEKILRKKLENIKEYYYHKRILKGVVDEPIDIEDFIYIVNEIKKIITVDEDNNILKGCTNDLIFEGSQGILLDQDFGFFPNVTRSNTTSKNAIEIMNKHDLWTKEREVYYVTRAYQTRHGNGFMTNEGKPLQLVNNEQETNVTNEFQGKFRTSILDLDLLNYALQCDSNFSHGMQKNLVITCVDQTGDIINVSEGKNRYDIHVNELPNKLKCDFTNVFVSRGPSLDCITKIK